MLASNPFPGSPSLKIKKFFTRLIHWLSSTRLGSLIRSPLAKSLFYRRPQRRLHPYDHWLEVNTWNTPRREVLQQALLEAQELPKLSLVMPVFNPPVRYLQRALESVKEQVYPHWELCLANDGSDDPEIYRLLESWQSREPRLQAQHCPQNQGVSQATNAAASLARHDFLFFLDQDDELPPDALAEVALCLARQPQTEVLYSDDDKIDGEGRRFDPHFKPDWSPELLLSYMYLSHLFGVRRDLYLAVGGMRMGFEGSQDYDLALRVTERTSRVAHIPKILYHWRVLPGSTAFSGHEKPYSYEAGRRAVQEALARRGLDASVRHPHWAAQGGCGIFTHEFPDTGPSVAIIIPTKNRFKMLKACLDSLAKTRYQNYQVYLIDNDSDDPDTLDYLRGLPWPIWRLANPGSEFNFSHLINGAAAKVSEDYLLLLNNDVEVISPSWLSQMVGYLGIPGVGAVGAKLLFPDGRVQCAGVLHGLHQGKPGHAFKLMPGQEWGYWAYAKVARNYGAVTAACMLTKRSLFQQLGGFDAQNFAVAYNDVDYCYRLLDSGHRVVYCPAAELLHHEGASRSRVDHLTEEVAFLQKYRQRYDPYYNCNLALQGGDFSVGSRTRAPASLRPIRALICTHNLNLGGAPYFLLELVLSLRDRGIIAPILHSPVDGPLRREFEGANIPVWVSPLLFSAAESLEDYNKGIDDFAQEIAARDIELILGNTLLAYYAIAAAGRLNLPSLWHIHESDPDQHLRGLPGVAARELLKCLALPYQVVFCSEATRALYQHLNEHNNFLTLHNVLNYERFARLLQPWTRDRARRALGLEPQEVMVLLLGTVCPRKGQKDLAAASHWLGAESWRQAKFFLVGDRADAYSREIHHLLSSLPPERQARMSMVAETRDVGLYYRAADVFLCTSRNESFPRVLLEAMYCRLPIITTPVFGVVEMLRDGCNALFYDPGDYQQLAEFLTTLIQDPARRRQLGENTGLGLAALPDYGEMLTNYGQLFREAFMSGKSRTG
jgi:GT2 family glycosyltransferase